MSLRPVLALLAAGLLAAGSWFWFRDRGALDPTALEARVTTLAGKKDTVALARLARQQCAHVEGEARQKCYEAYFLALSGEGRVALALGALQSLSRLEKRVEADGHVYTHVIGIKAWQPGRDIATVFRSCNGLFQSGCYHGVIQSYLTAESGVDSAKVAWTCDLIEGNQTDRWLRFQCVHGIGHGLQMSWNWDLPRALRGCDWLPSAWDRESCYGGAFMENAVASIPGGHHASAQALSGGQADDEHGEHEGHAVAPFKMRDSADALYPCSVVEEHYKAACFQLQGGIILQRNQYDFAKATADCDRAPEDLRHHCYLSLGTSASGLTVRDSRRAIQYCSNGDPGYQPWCFVGVVKNYIDVTARPEDGIAFCRLLPEGRNRRQCFVAVGEQVWVLHIADLAARDRECAKAAPDGDVDCRYGAGLLATAPEGLPIRAK
jgi:hypothetical protein